MGSQLYTIVRLFELCLMQYIICYGTTVNITSDRSYLPFLIHHLVATQLVRHTLNLHGRPRPRLTSKGFLREPRAHSSISSHEDKIANLAVFVFVPHKW